MAEWLVSKNPVLELCVLSQLEVLGATLGHCYSQYYRCVTKLFVD